MDTINTWIKGIDLDTAYSKTSNNRYLSLQGGQVITLEGESTGSIETEKGLLECFKIPASPSIYKLKLLTEKLIQETTPSSIEYHISINGNTQNGYINNLNSLNTNKDLYNALIAEINLDGVYIQYSEIYNNIVIWSTGLFSIELTTGTNIIDFKYIPPQTNLKSIGSGIYGNEFIIITCSDSNVSNGQIWKFYIDPTTLKVKTKNGLLNHGDYLLPEEHLIYSEELNLSKDYYITRIISNIETSDIGRIYWAYKHNPICSFNISVDYPLNTPLELLNTNTTKITGELEIKNILSGGYIGVGSAVQYFFRLRSSDGGIATAVSTGTDLIYLGNKIANTSSNDTSYHGAEFLEAVNDTNEDLYKSIHLEFTNLNTSYEFVELYFVYYETLNISNVYKIAELPIPESGNISYVHNGDSKDFENVNPSILNQRVLNITSANDIAIKDGRMLAVGVTVSDTNFEFDTRAYRFNKNGIALLKDVNLGDIILNPGYTTQDLINIPKQHDCINPYNKEDNNNWYDDLQYKYQSNGSTIGGEGLNISYKFTTYKLIGEIDITEEDHSEPSDSYSVGYKKPPYRRTERFSDSQTLDFLDGRIYDIGKEYKNFRSPKITSYLSGYAREEVYRFCIQFYDLKNNPYYASWIADIKMPSEWDYDFGLIENVSTNNNFNSQSTARFIVGKKTNNKVELYSLGLEFTVKNLNKISKKISGFSFGVVERLNSDKTKLFHGIHLPTAPIKDNSGNKFNYVEPLRPLSPTYKIQYNYINTTNTNRPNLSTLRSVDECLSIISEKWKSGDYVQPAAIYKTSEVGLRKDSEPYYNYRMHCAEFISHANFHRRTNLVDSVYIRNGDSIQLSSYNTLFDTVQNTWVMNSDYTTMPVMSQYDINGSDVDGAVEGLWRFSRVRTLLGKWEDFRITWDGYDPITNQSIDNDAINNLLITTANYKRYLYSQYGGDSYEARSNSIYNAITPIIKTTTNTDIIKSKVFGGDTYVTYYPILTVRKDRDNLTFNSIGYDNCNFTLSCPLESSINPYLFYGTSWFLNEVTYQQFYDTKDVYHYSEQLDNLYNTVYSQKNNIKPLIPKPSLVKDNNYFPSGIFISDRKINGDRIDSWLNFRVDNYKEVDNIYGPINTIINYEDRIIFFQDTAIGVQPINERAVTFNDDTGQQLVLGNGELLGKHGYISTRSGSIHNSSVVQTNYGVYYYDAISNKIKMLDLQSNIPLSDITGISSLLHNNLYNSNISEVDKPFFNKGVTASVDFINKRIIYNFITDNPFSICYNENMKAIEYFPYITPNFSLSGNKLIFVEDPNNFESIYLYGKGDYNTYFQNEKLPLCVKFIVNEPKLLNKIITNIRWTSDCFDKNTKEYVPLEGINKIRVYNKYQDTGYLTNITQVLQQWGHKVGFDIKDGSNENRIRSDWAIVEMIFENNNQNRLILNDVISNVTISHSGLDKY